MHRIVALVLGLAALLSVMLAPALAGKRVVLVIGNSAYRNVHHLPNPANYAEDMAALLSSLGFDVEKKSDLGRVAMEEAFSKFCDKAAGADIAVVFYAGHGMAAGHQNFLIPIDARLETDQRIPFEAVSLDHVMAALDGARGLRMVLLDGAA